MQRCAVCALALLSASLWVHSFFQTCPLSPSCTKGLLQTPVENASPSLSVNFLACVDEDYEAYLPLYAFCALALHANSVVEMVVPDVASFMKRHGAAMAFLAKRFGRTAVHVRSYSVPKVGMVPNTLRFLELPLILANYTYIGDVDIILTESVLSVHLERMALYKLPYSNVVRRNTTRLTGLHFVETLKYYNLELRQAQAEVILAKRSGNDEEELYRMCEKAHGMMPHYNQRDPHTFLRPEFGIHLSPNRWPLNPTATMKITIRPKTYNAFLRLEAETNMASLAAVCASTRNLIDVIHQLARK